MNIHLRLSVFDTHGEEEQPTTVKLEASDGVRVEGVEFLLPKGYSPQQVKQASWSALFTLIMNCNNAGMRISVPINSNPDYQDSLTVETTDREGTVEAIMRSIACLEEF